MASLNLEDFMRITALILLVIITISSSSALDLTQDIYMCTDARDGAKDHFGLYNGTLINAVVNTTFYKVGNSSFYFDGNNDTISYADYDWMTSGKTFSIVAIYYYMGNGSDFRSLLYKNAEMSLDIGANGADGNGWDIRFQDRVGYTDCKSTGNPVSANAWQIMVMTYDPTDGCQFFVNDVNYSSDRTVTLRDSANIMMLSKDSTTTSFAGYVNLFAMYNRSITAEERTAWNNSGSLLSCSDLDDSDIISPGKVTSVSLQPKDNQSLPYTFVPPSDIDYNHTEIWSNEVFIANVSSGIVSYNLTGRTNNTCYTTIFRAVDHSGNKAADTSRFDCTLQNSVTKFNSTNIEWEPFKMKSKWQSDQGKEGGNAWQLVFDISINQNPLYSQNVILCTDTTKVWKSSNGGENWTLTARDVPNDGCTDAVTDYNNPNYMCAWFGRMSSAPNSNADGLWCSQNGGANWSFAGIVNPPIRQKDGDQIYVDETTFNGTCSLNWYWGNDGFIYRSTNCGQTWSLFKTLSPRQYVNDIAGSSPFLYISTNTSLLSLNLTSGTLSTLSATGMTTSGNPLRDCDTYPGYPGTVYCTNGDLYRSTNYGSSFSLVNNPSPSLYMLEVGTRSVILSPSSVAPNYPYYSLDNGTTLLQPTLNTSESVHVSDAWYFYEPITCDWNQSYCLTHMSGGGWVGKSTDAGATWHESSSGMVGERAMEWHFIERDERDIAYIPSWDYGLGFLNLTSMIYTDLTDTTVSDISSGFVIPINWSSPSSCILLTTFGHWSTGMDIYKSTDCGQNWVVKYTGSNSNSWGEMCPDNNNLIYTEDAYSRDAGETWTANPSGTRAFAMDDRCMVYGVRDLGATVGVYNSSDGATWSQIGGGLVASNVYDLAIDPFNSSHILVATSQDIFEWNGAAWFERDGSEGLDGTTNYIWVDFDNNVQGRAYTGKLPYYGYGHAYGSGFPAYVYMTSNGGSTWTSVSSNLGDMPSYRFNTNPYKTEELYVTGAGQWVATLNGETESGSCYPIYQNTSWSAWQDMQSCQANDIKQQNRSMTEYDMYACPGSTTTVTWEFTNTTCNYCSYNAIYTSWSDWADIQACQPDGIKAQNRSRTQYDANYSTCYAVTGIESDLWNSGENITTLEPRLANCGYIAISLVNITQDPLFASDQAECVARMTVMYGRATANAFANYSWVQSGSVVERGNKTGIANNTLTAIDTMTTTSISGVDLTCSISASVIGDESSIATANVTRYVTPSNKNFMLFSNERNISIQEFTITAEGTEYDTVDGVVEVPATELGVGTYEIIAEADGYEDLRYNVTYSDYSDLNRTLNMTVAMINIYFTEAVEAWFDVAECIEAFDCTSTNTTSITMNATDLSKDYISLRFNSDMNENWQQFFKFYNDQQTTLNVTLYVETIDIQQDIKVTGLSKSLENARVCSYRLHNNRVWLPTFCDYTDQTGTANLILNDQNNYKVCAEYDGYMTRCFLENILPSSANTLTLDLLPINTAEGTVYVKQSCAGIYNESKSCNLLVYMYSDSKEVCLSTYRDGVYLQSECSEGTQLLFTYALSSLYSNYSMVLNVSGITVYRISHMYSLYEPDVQIGWELEDQDGQSMIDKLQSNQKYLILFYVIMALIGVITGWMVERYFNGNGVYGSGVWFTLLGTIGFGIFFIPALPIIAHFILKRIIPMVK